MIHDDFTLLKPFANELENATEEICKQWIQRQRVVQTLAAHRLSPNFFKKHFGHRVYGIFIDVMRGGTRAGNCPIIIILLHFCDDKHIKLHELYILCSELKNVVLFYFTKNMQGKVDDAVFWHLADLLDVNFSGVIEEFMEHHCEVIYGCENKFCNNETPKQAPKQAAIADHRLKDIRYSKEERYGSDILFEMLDSTVIDKIELFTEDLDELLIIFYDIEEANKEKSFILMKECVRILSKFYVLVDAFAVFPIIVSTFKNLSLFLKELSVEAYEHSEQKRLLILNLIGLIKDLEQWITIVFIQKIADDVHYLDASFANNVVEIESIFTKRELVSNEEDDLEFF
jgi:hypothetical protein